MKYFILIVYFFIVSCSFISQPNDVKDIDPKLLGTPIPKFKEINFPETAEFIGAQIKLITNTNRALYYQVSNGQGFMSDQTNSWIVGLDKNEKVENIEVN